MKKIILILSVFGLSPLIAQEVVNNDNPDTTKFNLPNMTVILIEGENGDSSRIEVENHEDEPREYEANDYAKWAGLGFGVNGLMNVDQSIGLKGGLAPYEIDYGKSLNVQFNIMQKRFNLGVPHIGITTGLGFEFSRYGFKQGNTLMANSDSTWMMIDSVNYRKNFLKTTYLQAPLLLEINTSRIPGKGLYLAAGVVGGYKIGTKIKQKIEVDGRDYKNVVRDDFNVNPFRLSATARVGFNDIVLYANYGLTSLFENNRGPELYPLSCGIQLAF